MQKNRELTSLQIYAPLLWRVFAFLVSFIIISAGIGLHIMHYGLFWRYGFQWYAGAGKGLLFAVIAFFMLTWHKPRQQKLTAWHIVNMWWLVGAMALFILDWKAIDELSHVSTSLVWVAIAHMSILSTVSLLLCFSFGVQGIRAVIQMYHREVLASIAIGTAFIGFLYLVYGLWTVLASIVLNSVRILLGTVGVHAIFLAPRSLLLSKFAITVAEGCSGIDSIALFTGLYALVGIVDWDRFSRNRFVIAFLPALVILFGLNILRVFVLIVAGYYINPQIAFSLFHTYAGMIFFIFYSAIFWSISYRWMLKKTN